MKMTLKSSIIGLILFLSAPTGVLAARLYTAPPQTAVCAGSAFNLQLLLDTQGEAINAGQVDLTFDPNTGQINSIDTSGSVFRFFAEGPDFSNSAGTIHMIGGLPTPGYQGPNGLVAELSMVIDSTGAPDLRYSDSSDILLDDGFGTSASLTLENPTFSVLPASDPACIAVTPSPSTPGPTPTPCPTCQLRSESGEVLDLRLCEVHVECTNAEERQFDVFLGADDPTQCPIITRCDADTRLTENVIENVLLSPLKTFVAASRGVYAGPFILGVGLGAFLILALYLLSRVVRRWYLRTIGRKEHPPQYPDIPRT